MGNLIVGQSDQVSAHWTYSVPLTQEKARELAQVLPAVFGWKSYQVWFVHQDLKNLHARVFDATRVIKLYTKGQNLGTLLHELSHESAHGHGPAFRRNMTRYLHLVDNMRQALKEV